MQQSFLLLNDNAKFRFRGFDVYLVNLSLKEHLMFRFDLTLQCIGTILISNYRHYADIAL